MLIRQYTAKEWEGISGAFELHGSETKPEIPSHSFASLLKKLMEKNKK